jgi:hypothetical protein
VVHEDGADRAEQADAEVAPQGDLIPEPERAGLDVVECAAGFGAPVVEDLGSGNGIDGGLRMSEDRHAGRG